MPTTAEAGDRALLDLFRAIAARPDLEVARRLGSMDAAGTMHLVVTQMDGEFSAAEVEHLSGQALAQWLHPIEVPPEWFE
jgi:hypothetical protein